MIMKKNSPASPEKVHGLQGRVVQGHYGVGSKSERETFYLDTGSKKYLLRRKSGPVFGDEELKKFQGKTIECAGFIMGDTLLAEQIILVG